MTLTASQAVESITHALAGVPSVTALRLVNEAGRQLCNMHAWNFLKRDKVTLASVASQPYISLPADFGAIIGIELEGGIAQNWKRVDTATFLRIESGVWTQSGWGYYTVIENPVSTDGTAPEPRLALWPTPTTDNSTFAQLRYRATWTELADDNDTVQIPVFAETLFLQLCRAFGRGYEEDDAASLDARVAEIMAGPIFMAAKKQDASSQWYYGRLKNGAADQGVGYRSWEGSFSPPS